MNEEETVLPIKQTSSLKVSKMSKGYNWEIKIYDDDISQLIAKTKQLDIEMRETYGSKE